MRSAADLRQRWLDVLPRMVTRPGMWAADGRAFDVLARGLIADLCFLDEREQDSDDVNTLLHGYGKLGVAGPFIALFGKDRNCAAEVASVFAEQFHRLGYLPAERLLGAGEWDRLTTRIRQRIDGHDARRNEVEADFGSGIALTLYDEAVRWAPVWWQDNAEGLSDEQQAIAAQLRIVESGDP